MYVVELKFDDNPVRLQRRPAHRDLLIEWAERGLVRGAGPWEDGTGAMVIFDVATEEDLDALIAEDHYYESPGLTITSKRRWNNLIT